MTTFPRAPWRRGAAAHAAAGRAVASPAPAARQLPAQRWQRPASESTLERLADRLQRWADGDGALQSTHEALGLVIEYARALRRGALLAAEFQRQELSELVEHRTAEDPSFQSGIVRALVVRIALAHGEFGAAASELRLWWRHAVVHHTEAGRHAATSRAEEARSDAARPQIDDCRRLVAAVCAMLEQPGAEESTAYPDVEAMGRSLAAELAPVLSPRQRLRLTAPRIAPPAL